MPEQLRSLLLEIERVRTTLYALTEENALTDDEVISLSRTLDELVNSYLCLVVKREG